VSDLDLDTITPIFIGRWARGLEQAAKRLAECGADGRPYDKSDAVQMAADIVVEVLGAEFIRTDVLNEAVKAASPDPLGPDPLEPAA
jgi:hypothetical protein